jgi:hypothetical protein
MAVSVESSMEGSNVVFTLMVRRELGKVHTLPFFSSST